MDKSTTGAGSEMLFLGERIHIYAPCVEDYGKRDTEELNKSSRECTHVQKARRSSTTV